jgi:cytoplasmic iron level regulating protein YaaA (DUF328/UPF0246 family)
MSSFIAILSPAKLLDDQTHYPNLACTEAIFSAEAAQLAGKLKKLTPHKLAELMDMSDALATETHARFATWKLPFTHQNAHPAMLMFKGEVYRGLQAQEFNPKQLEFAQKRLRILSGLYGIMRPLDLVMPYRLMMGTPFEFDKKTPNLYSFWKQKITAELDKELGKNDVLINLASHEYFKVIDSKVLNRRIMECEFKEKKGNAFVTVNTYSKLARGKMARFIIDNQIKKPDDIQSFDYENYSYNSSLSGPDRFVFTRS